MKVDGKDMRPIWLDEDMKTVKVIDQRELPHRLSIIGMTTVDEVIDAIREMVVRGAPLIGAAAAYGMFLIARHAIDNSSGFIEKEANRLRNARPTAVNLAWAVDRILPRLLADDDPVARIETAKAEALAIVRMEADNCRRIGLNGLPIIRDLSEKKAGRTVHLLTHCNAGWLACIEYGTATAPMYVAHEAGIDIHVWVDETRPLNQGARLTAWELGKAGIKHTVVTDNSGGHLMQHGLVDMVITGTDRTTRTGDVANKIGTYLKALAAADNGVPFYVALPSTTFDWSLRDGVREIPIEERNPDEVRYITGAADGKTLRVLTTPDSSPARNDAFDVTPARLVTGLITERGICRANETDILRLFPERQEPV